MIHEQQCSRCKRKQPIHDFHKDKRTVSGHTARCKTCVREVGIAWRAANPVRKKQNDSEWYRNNAKKAIAQVARWKRANPDRVAKAEVHYRLNNYMKIREKALLKRYGVDFKTYDALMTRQGDRCAVCKRDFGHGNPPQVDHCHTSKKVRGILCNKCNKGIGMFNDNTELFGNAIAYLTFSNLSACN